MPGRTARLESGSVFASLVRDRRQSDGDIGCGGKEPYVLMMDITTAMQVVQKARDTPVICAENDQIGSTADTKL